MSGAALAARVRVDRGDYTLDVEVHAGPGEIVAVMGPSGAGKSTLFGAIAGFVPLSDGHVRLDDKTVQTASGTHVAPHDRGVILLGQEARLFPHLSARENVAFGPRARRTPRRAAREDADAWLDRVGLGALGDRRPAQLSGGQQQRVALARALATAPRLLLLDEPLTSLDPETADGIRALVREQLAATSTTALVATHAAVDATALASRLVVVEHGRITQTGAVEEVLRSPATTFVAALAPGAASWLGASAGGPWRARVLSADSLADGTLVRLRTPDGVDVELRMPGDVTLQPGAELVLGPPTS